MRFRHHYSPQSAHEVFAENAREFFAKIADAQFSFEANTEGQSTAMVLRQGGRSITGKRLEKDALTAPSAQRQQIAVNPSILDGYVGRYQLTPDFVLTITRGGGQLFAQATGQGKFEIYPETERAYIVRVADIQITFEIDERGRATSITLRQGGVSLLARRMPE